ncbi:hypothetical protein JNB11_08155 [Kocuria palustris]|nr:hypothetical protein [Kocuria palustris]
MSLPPRKLLSTSSPEGIHVALQITPTRLANLLIRKGPLPIRHITALLAVEVPSFDMLSLSKQRRLIMAAMEQEDPVNNVVFEKIGWGQWAVRKADLDFIVSEGTEPQENSENPSAPPAKVNVADLRNQKLGWTKKKVGTTKREAKNPRRTLITVALRNLHNTTVPGERIPGDDGAAHPMMTRSKTARTEVAIASDLELLEESEDEEVFPFDLDVPVKFANRVPIKVVLPPMDQIGYRRWSHSLAMLRPQLAPLRQHWLTNRLRLNSMDALENYVALLAQLLTILVTLLTALLPYGSPPAWLAQGLPYGNYTASAGASPAPEPALGRSRRKSLFNESHVRLTLGLVPKSHPVQLAPIGTPQTNQPLPHLLVAMLGLVEPGLDTDEEDWATIGAETLRQTTSGRVTKKKRHLILGRRPLRVATAKVDDLNDDEKLAAMALVELMH